MAIKKYNINFLNKIGKPNILYITNFNFGTLSIYNEFISFVPVINLLVHLFIVNNQIEFLIQHEVLYISFMSFCTFIINLFWYIPFMEPDILQSMNAGAFGLIFGKSAVITLNFISYASFEMKYFIGISGIINMLFLCTNCLSLILSWIIMRRISLDEEIKKLIIHEVEI